MEGPDSVLLFCPWRQHEVARLRVPPLRGRRSQPEADPRLSHASSSRPRHMLGNRSTRKYAKSLPIFSCLYFLWWHLCQKRKGAAAQSRVSSTLQLVFTSALLKVGGRLFLSLTKNSPYPISNPWSHVLLCLNLSAPWPGPSLAGSVVTRNKG